ncbi:hypothetical protein C6V82_05105 [Halomonas urumqiensis]|nr:hypothetical protein C6V82_05105 [Halomonas urumqiensis]
MSGFLAAVFVPLTLGLAGHWYSDAIRDRETSLKEQEFAREWVQLSLDVLREESGGDDTEVLRQWAVDVLNHFSDIEIQFDGALREALVEGRARLPEAVTQAPAPEASRFTRMIQLQEAALEALLERDIGTAILYMDEAHALWHDFRTIWEVLGELRRSREQLGDDQGWSELYRNLLRLWDLRDIDPGLRDRLREQAS